MVNFQRKIYHFSRFQRGSNIFQGGGGGVQLFPGVSNCIFPIDTQITCDFPGRVRTPCPPPLDPHLKELNSTRFIFSANFCATVLLRWRVELQRDTTFEYELFNSLFSGSSCIFDPFLIGSLCRSGYMRCYMMGHILWMTEIHMYSNSGTETTRNSSIDENIHRYTKVNL